MVRRSFAVLVLAWLFGWPAVGQAGERVRVDLELVLAVDASGSVDAEEYVLQLAGIAAAFRDPAILNAITSGPFGRIAVAMVVWADASIPKDETPWAVIDSLESAESFARLIESYPRRVEGGTGIGAAVIYAIQMMQWNEIDGSRLVVDVSGDGKETMIREENSMMLPAARVMANANGVTVNGLVILTEDDLESWYRDNVVTGPGHFVIPAASYRSFASAIREKLLREIEAKVAGDDRTRQDWRLARSVLP
jgi:hypothetical protein